MSYAAADRPGTLGTTTIYLAGWRTVQQRYRRAYIPVDPEGRDIPGTTDRVAAETHVRPWHIDSWRGGEGEDLFQVEGETYDVSTNVRPRRVGDGLELGADQSVPVENGGLILNDTHRFGYGLGGLWTMLQTEAYEWNTTSNDWDAGITLAPSPFSAQTQSLTDGDDTFMYSGHGIRINRWDNTGAGAEWYGTLTGDDFAEDVVLRSWGGILFALDGDDLYKIDKTAADTRTRVADLFGSSADFLAQTPWAYNRMSLSDKGPIWIQRLDNGQTFIWEYNNATDTSARIGKLPVDFAFPYSIFFANGFVFVAFRYANAHTESGDAYIYFQRGAQRGVAGPVRSTTGTTVSKPILIAGVQGDDLIFYYDGAIWAYNLSFGGISQVATQTTTGEPQDTITFGKEIFIADVTSGGNTDATERFDLETFTTENASIDSGRFDFGYLGADKTLLDVTVVTEPLPANTTVDLSYSVEGGSFTAATGTHDTDNATSFTWTISDNTTTVRGRDFELRLIPNTTVTTASPVIRSQTARATGAEHRLEWVLEVDVGDRERQASFDILDSINTLVTNQAVVQFQDPWQNRDTDATDNFDVTVEDWIPPDEESPEAAYGVLRLRAVSLV